MLLYGLEIACDALKLYHHCGRHLGKQLHPVLEFLQLDLLCLCRAQVLDFILGSDHCLTLLLALDRLDCSLLAFLG